MNDAIHCKNVFQNGEKTPSGEKLTELWIKLIRQAGRTARLTGYGS